MTAAEWLSLQATLAELFSPLIALWVEMFLVIVIILAVLFVFFQTMRDRLSNF